LPEYEGYDELIYGWLTGVNWSGGRLNAEIDPLPELRQIASWADSAWIAPSGKDIPGNEYAAALWGLFTWNPDLFEQMKAEKKIIEDLFGEGTHPWMQQLNDFYHYTLLEICFAGRKDAQKRWALDQCIKLLTQVRRRFRGHVSPLSEFRINTHFERIAEAIATLKTSMG